MRDLSTITKDLRLQFDVDQKNARYRKEADKHQVKEEILTITWPRERSECYEIDDDIKCLTKNNLNISFSLEYPRMSGWNPRDPLLITTYIRQI